MAGMRPPGRLDTDLPLFLVSTESGTVRQALEAFGITAAKADELDPNSIAGLGLRIVDEPAHLAPGPQMAAKERDVNVEQESVANLERTATEDLNTTQGNIDQRRMGGLSTEKGHPTGWLILDKGVPDLEAVVSTRDDCRLLFS